MTVVLHPRKIGFVTRIRTQMEHEVAENVIKVLRENVDIFAFSSWDMTSILPKVAIHHLNVDLKAKPCETKVESLWSRERCHYRAKVEKLLEEGMWSGSSFPNGCPMSFGSLKVQESGGCVLIFRTSIRFTRRIITHFRGLIIWLILHVGLSC